ncbi:MAG: SGNH/GDSL hydrolase family protein [Sandaracinus sp.]|nr:SGNH/GDSL hydrolase family protein [Sandaracinus sp.]
MPTLFLALALLVALAPCGGSTTSEAPVPAAPSGGETVAPEVGARAAATPPPPSDEPAPPPAPPDPVLSVRAPSIHSAITPRELAALEAIAARGEHRDDVFAKMGGSSIESRAFLHCFGRGDHVDLGAQTALEASLEHFRAGNAQGRDPFRRESLATKVGWSVRHGLTGRPPRVLEEVRAIDARYALAFFGGNDVQARDPREFGERMEHLLELLTERGVIPVLGAVMPRGDEAEMDEVARRYNRLSRALAMAWGLPYVDFYLAVDGLPNRGLAGDGVHPNVLLDGGRSRACDLTPEGLERGQNQRNLRTLEVLDRLRRARSEGALDPAHDAAFGAGSATAPLHLTEVPYGERGTERSAELDGYSCEGARPSPGGERVFRIRVETPTRLWVAAFARTGPEPHVHVLGAAPDPATCVTFGPQLEVDLAPGVHHVAVEAPTADRPLTVLFDAAPIEPTAE